MIPISDALSLFTLSFVSYPLICTAVVALTLRLLRSL